MCVSPLLALMLVNFIRFQCVNPCLLACTADMNTTLIRNDPSLIQTKHAACMVTSCFQRLRPECKIEINSTTGTQRKSIALVWMVSVVIAILSLKKWDATTTIVPLRRRVHVGARKQ